MSRLGSSFLSFYARLPLFWQVFLRFIGVLASFLLASIIATLFYPLLDIPLELTSVHWPSLLPGSIAAIVVTQMKWRPRLLLWFFPSLLASLWILGSVYFLLHRLLAAPENPLEYWQINLWLSTIECVGFLLALFMTYVLIRWHFRPSESLRSDSTLSKKLMPQTFIAILVAAAPFFVVFFYPLPVEMGLNILVFAGGGAALFLVPAVWLPVSLRLLIWGITVTTLLFVYQYNVSGYLPNSYMLFIVNLLFSGFLGTVAIWVQYLTTKRNALEAIEERGKAASIDTAPLLSSLQEDFERTPPDTWVAQFEQKLPTG